MASLREPEEDWEYNCQGYEASCHNEDDYDGFHSFLRLSIRVSALIYAQVYMSSGNDDTFLNTPRHTSIRERMNKKLVDWLKKRMTQIDERVTHLEEQVLNGEGDQW
jgi:hypothetical protein